MSKDDIFSEGIVLYKLDGCPFCKKVEDKLDNLDLDYTEVEVPSSHKDRKLSSEYSSDVPTVDVLSGQTGVPVIVDKENDIDGIPESDDIVEYLEETYG